MAPTTDRRSTAHWRAVCSENCTHGSVGGGWKSAAEELWQLAGRLPYLVDGNRDLEDPTDQSHGGLFRGFIPEQRRRSRRPHPGCVPLPRGVRQQHHLGLSARRRLSTPARGRVDTRGVDGFAGVRTHGARREPRRRSGHAPASDSPGAGPTREEVLDTVTTRLELSRNQATDAYGLAEQFETNPRSIWGYVQGLTRLSQRTPWQDHRFALDRAASRLLTTVH
jgi:hypothetical protein